MKKLIFTLAIAFASMMALTSCGGSSIGEFTVDAKGATNVRCRPKLIDDFIEIKQGTYPVKYNEGKVYFSVDLVVVKEIDKASMAKYQLDEFEASVRDMDDNFIDQFDAADAQAKYAKLINANVGDVVEVTFVSDEGTEEEQKTLGAAIKKIKIRFKAEEQEEPESNSYSYSTSYDNEESMSSTTSSADWDKILDDYEKYADACIRLSKKVQEGDMTAMSEYTTMLEKLSSLGEKLQNAGEMTSSQMARYTKITTKMSKAALQ